MCVKQKKPVEIEKEFLISPENDAKEQEHEEIL